MARSSLGCSARGISPISSRKSVPPSASSKTPVRSETAPLKAPRTCPKSSLSMRFSGMAPQSIGNEGPRRPARRGVERARDDVLARPRLPLDEHGGVGGRDALEDGVEAPHLEARADQLAEARAAARARRTPAPRRRRCGRPSCRRARWLPAGHVAVAQPHALDVGAVGAAEIAQGDGVGAHARSRSGGARRVGSASRRSLPAAAPTRAGPVVMDAVAPRPGPSTTTRSSDQTRIVVFGAMRDVPSSG